jgi:hypothetical protein
MNWGENERIEVNDICVVLPAGKGANTSQTAGAFGSLSCEELRDINKSAKTRKRYKIKPIVLSC